MGRKEKNRPWDRRHIDMKRHSYEGQKEPEESLDTCQEGGETRQQTQELVRGQLPKEAGH